MNPDDIASGTALNQNDAVCRALRELLLIEARRIRREGLDCTPDGAAQLQRFLSLYQELGGVLGE